VSPDAALHALPERLAQRRLEDLAGPGLRQRLGTQLERARDLETRDPSTAVGGAASSISSTIRLARAA
jgi:hypothetical protein